MFVTMTGISLVKSTTASLEETTRREEDGDDAPPPADAGTFRNLRSGLSLDLGSGLQQLRISLWLGLRQLRTRTQPSGRDFLCQEPFSLWSDRDTISTLSSGPPKASHSAEVYSGLCWPPLCTTDPPRGSTHCCPETCQMYTSLFLFAGCPPLIPLRVPGLPRCSSYSQAAAFGSSEDKEAAGSMQWFYETTKRRE